MNGLIPIPASHDYRLVTLSVVIARVASFAALDLAGWVTANQGRTRLGWDQIPLPMANAPPISLEAFTSKLRKAKARPLLFASQGMARLLPPRRGSHETHLVRGR